MGAPAVNAASTRLQAMTKSPAERQLKRLPFQHAFQLRRS